MAEFKNYKIKDGKGVFYLSFDKEIDGYDDTYVKDGKTYYHKFFPNLNGTLTKAELKDSKFGTKISLMFEEEEGVVGVLDIDLFRDAKNGTIDSWAKAIAPLLSSLKIGKEINIWLNRKDKNKKGFLYRNIYFKIDGESPKLDFVYGDVPKWEETKHSVTGKVTKDSTKQDKFYYEKITEALNSLERPKGSEKTDKPTKTEKKAVETKEEDFDDSLPF